MRVPFSIAAPISWAGLIGLTFFSGGLVWILGAILDEHSVVFVPGDLGVIEAAEQLGSSERVGVRGVLEDLSPEAVREAEAACPLSDPAETVVVDYPLVPEGGPVYRTHPESEESELVLVFLHRTYSCDQEITAGYDGHPAGTELACFGIPTGGAQLSVGCENAYTGSRADWLYRWYRNETIAFRIGQWGLGIFYCWYLYGWVRSPRYRKRWRELARAFAWQHRRTRIGPGTLHGEWKERPLEIRSAHLLVQGDAVILMELPDYLSLARAESVLDSMHDDELILVDRPPRVGLRYPHLGAMVGSKGQEMLAARLSQLDEAVTLIEDTYLSDLKSLAERESWILQLGVDWIATDASGERRFQSSPLTGVPTILSHRLPDTAPEGLRIQARESAPEVAGLGHAILDSEVSISASEPAQVSAVVGREEFVASILELVRGHGGEVEGERIVVVRDGPMLRPSEIWSTMERLAQSLQAPPATEPEPASLFLVFAQDTKDRGEPPPENPVARFSTREEAEACAAKRLAESKQESGPGWSLWGTDYWVVGPVDPRQRS
jgi:hypothetical protein